VKLTDLVQELGLECLTPDVAASSIELSAGYVSDLLSDVLAHGPSGGVLVTVQVHLNVIAVATHAEMAAVVFAHGRRPEPQVVEKAAAEGVALYVTSEAAFDVVGRMYGLGLRGPMG
jgi:hypothetical protein